MALPNFSESTDAPSLKQRAERVFAAAIDYIAARWQLFHVEARMAAGHLTRVLAAALTALLCLVLAYLTAWGALIVWSAHRWADGNTTVPLLATAGFHLLAAAALVWWLVKKAPRQSLFAATRQELQEDRLWLTRNQKSRS